MFCECWIRNTIRNVTIVVPVLMMSCQVSENPNTGPLTAQITNTIAATENAHGLPAARELCSANRSKRSRTFDR